MPQIRNRRRQSGVTFVDAAVTLAIASVVLGSALPSFESTRARRHLEGAAAQLETELQHARFNAVALNQTVRISFTDLAGGTCYVVHTGGAGDCSCGPSNVPSCAAEAKALHSAHFDASSPVSLQSNSESIGFDADKGTVTPTGTLVLRNRRNEEIRLVLNIMGRVRSCAATEGIAGLPRC
jgi:type IV fimbrial biogenesis protein FimT